MSTAPRWFPFAPGAARAWTESRTPIARAFLRCQVPPPLDVQPTRGKAWFPVVVDHPEFAGTLVAVRAGATTPDGVEVPPEIHGQVRRWLGALLGCPEQTLPPLRLVHDVLPVDHPLTGRSLEMAATVAWVSDLLGRAARSPVIVSGTAEAGVWGPVERVAQKSRVCAIEAPGVRPLLLSSAQDPDTVLAEAFGPSWRQDLSSAVHVHPSATADDAWHEFRRQQVEPAAELAQRALAAGAAGRDAALCHWMIGAAALHRGEATAARDQLDAARSRFDQLDRRIEAVEPYEVEELEAFLAVANVDLGHPSAAVERLVPSEERLGSHRDRGARRARLQVLGSLARAEAMLGRLDDAIAHLTTSERDAGVPTERCRTQMDLAELHRRAGDLESARARLAHARTSLASTPSTDRAKTARFLSLYEARAGVHPPAEVTGAADWGDWPQPAEVAEHLLARDPSGLDGWLAQQLPGPSTVCTFVFLGYVARRLELTGSPLPDELVAAAERLAATPIDPPVQGALLALVRGDPTAWIRQCPY